MVKQRLTQLDAIRGIAALMVVGFHFTTRYQALFGHTSPVIGLPWAWHGVHLFFGLSGFVIYMTLQRTRTAMDFIVSRFSRLYPAYWAAILLTTLVVYAGGMTALQMPAPVVAINFSMVQEYIHVPSVDGVYWTLKVELAFYAVMFALFLLRKLAWIDGLLFAWIGLKWVWWLHPLSYTLGLLLVQQYIPYFAIGVACYRLWAKQSRLVLAAPTLLFAIATAWVIDGAEAGVTAVVVAGVFLLFAYDKLGWLRWPPFVWLGGVSYTLYLLHENIGWTLLHHLEAAGVPPYAAIAIALPCCLALAYAVTRLVERPVMGWIRGAYYKRRKQVEESAAQPEAAKA